MRISPGPTGDSRGRLSTPLPRRPPRPPSWGLPIASGAHRAHPHLGPGAPTHAEAPSPPGCARRALINSLRGPCNIAGLSKLIPGCFLLSLKPAPGTIARKRGSWGWRKGQTLQGFGMTPPTQGLGGLCGVEACNPIPPTPVKRRSGSFQVRNNPEVGFLIAMEIRS